MAGHVYIQHQRQACVPETKHVDGKADVERIDHQKELNIRS